MQINCQRNLFASFLIVLSAIFLAPAVFAEGKASISFRNSTHDFGIIRNDKGPVSYDFVFENKGDANLIVKRAKAECGCTSVSFPQNPIPPGKTGVITVKYSPLGQRGSFSKGISVWTNAKQSKVSLKIKGSAVPPSEKQKE